MNEPNQPIIPATAPPSVESLQQELDSLQILTRALLVAMLWLCVAAALFLYRQVVSSNQQVTQQKQLVQLFETSYRPGLDHVVAALQAFARTNASFTPILQKYDLVPNAPVAQGQKK